MALRLVQLSDIHVWRYTWNAKRLFGLRILGITELLMGRARRFPLGRFGEVVDRVRSLAPDHILITGDLTTTALPSEFQEARRLLGPILADKSRVTMIPGNHDRTTRRSYLTRRFEATFGEFMPSANFPWLRWLDAETAILGLDATRWHWHFSPRGYLPDAQLAAARVLTSDPATLPRRLIIACHYPVAAPPLYRVELAFKRLENEPAVRAWLKELGPHLYCCGHVHAPWAFRPPEIPNQLCVNSGSPTMIDPTGLRQPGFLEIVLDGIRVEVRHHAWTGSDWKVVPMTEDVLWPMATPSLTA
ncbi:Calcineurin-like phosphoesterase superfamily domain protein [Aquisphaera giovannonii]|uniref:Calcineurin-like phosphoesterase superfamily domain protein n=1 Tax=Aquisphaera giovannonii TaxID=406548 RepID=A0A5B9W5W5_9BACT|nr:metallophosphoesterase [Aquisphaera giovannonii]QEH36042.1 Calcineurin-like phosphoesterase superfamily domain protein [Aquisphaera giovannonii]